MHEILGRGEQREEQIQRMDEIVMVAIEFCAEVLRFAKEARKRSQGGDSSSTGANMAVIASVSTC